MTPPDESVAAIIERAEQRGRSSGLPYRGAVTPAEAFALVQAGAATLVDVRSSVEWEYVGHYPQSKLVEWRRLPGGVPNPDFLAQLGQLGSPDGNYLFMCRSGARSHAAAAVAARHGYAAAFNVLEGFEGALDDRQQRGHLGGWRHAGLPWRQG